MEVLDFGSECTKTLWGKKACIVPADKNKINNKKKVHKSQRSCWRKM